MTTHTPGMRRWLLTLEEENKMTKQPEALRLALRLEYAGQNEAATELRRLHESNTELLAALKMAEPMLQAMQKNIVRYLPQYEKMPALDQVRAAIAKAERTTS